MFDLRRIPIVRALFPFAGGSLAGSRILHSEGMPDLALWSTQAWMLFFAALLWILLIAVFRWIGRNPGYRVYLFSFFAFTIIFVSGLLSSIVSRPVDPVLPLDQKLIIRGEITEGPKPGRSSWSYGMNVRMVACRDSVFKVRTHLKVHVKSSSIPEKGLMMPGAGETWQLYGRLAPIRNSGNPGAPDFRAIMSRKNCWYRFYPDSNADQGRGRDFPGRKIDRGRSISAARIRRAVSSHWKGHEREISLLKAVCLGDRSDLTVDLKQAYSHAGAMHLLAVSGLHIGLIWWVLYRFFSWMTRISGKELYRSLTIIILLWAFAFVSGFSSSVCRSATMFTLFTAGRLMDQRTHALNGILVSAFLLILIRPQSMMDVGFQLSYAAILGIACLYPVFRSMCSFQNRVLRRVWEATLISLSAQLSTAPLVIYYFHQIPVYSLVTSLLTVPLLSVLISIFVISVPFATSGIFCEFFNALLVKLAYLMNLLVGLIASVPGAVIGEMKLNTISLCLWMALLVVGMIMLNHRSVLPRYLMLMLTSASLCWASVTRYRCLHSSELIISHFNRASMLTFREGARVDHYCWYRDSVTSVYMKKYIAETWSRRDFQSRTIDLHQVLHEDGSITACRQVAPGMWLLGNDQRKGWFVSGASELEIKGIQFCQPELNRILAYDFVLLSKNPPVWRIPGDLLTGSGELILDGSNQMWYSVQLEHFRTDKLLNLDEYITAERGAYLKRW
ncbi:MAG: ComEC/Rec2 family competence protein [Bacteroidota bacterium]